MANYGDLTRTRSLSGNQGTSTVSDADITAALNAGDSMINMFTGVSNWASGDDAYYAIVEASEFLGSFYVRSRFRDEGNQAIEHYNRAKMILQDVIQNSSRIYTSASTGYRSFPANPLASPYVNNNGPFGTSDGSGVDPGAI